MVKGARRSKLVREYRGTDMLNQLTPLQRQATYAFALGVLTVIIFVLFTR